MVKISIMVFKSLLKMIMDRKSQEKSFFYNFVHAVVSQLILIGCNQDVSASEVLFYQMDHMKLRVMVAGDTSVHAQLAH